MAKLLDALDVQPGELVLDVGCGLGYSAAVIARLAETVVAVEEDEALAADAQRLLSEEGVDNAVVVTGKLAEGSAKCAPYDVITIEGGVETVPEAILEQLGARYLAEAAPRDLCLIHVVGIGDRVSRGAAHFAHDGMVKRCITSALIDSPVFIDLALADRIEAYTLPQGVLSLLR